jgi:hypothetical protein
MNAFQKVLEEIKLILKTKNQISKVFQNNPQNKNLIKEHKK